MHLELMACVWLRLVRSLRNEHLSVFKCAAFVDRGELLAVGMHSGEVRPGAV